MFLAALGMVLEFIPLVRGAWKSILERGLEVSIQPSSFFGGRTPNPRFTIMLEKGFIGTLAPPYIDANFALRLVNHRTNQSVRIIGLVLSLKAKRFLLWRRTIWEFQVHTALDEIHAGEPFTDILLEPLSSPLDVQCKVYREISEPERLPNHSEIWLDLEMVGPKRRLS